jgi:hypothetical protein
VDATALNYQLQTVKRVALVNIWTRLKKISPQLNTLSLAGETVVVPPRRYGLGDELHRRFSICGNLGKTEKTKNREQRLDEVHCTIETHPRRAKPTGNRPHSTLCSTPSDAQKEA